MAQLLVSSNVYSAASIDKKDAAWLFNSNVENEEKNRFCDSFIQATQGQNIHEINQVIKEYFKTENDLCKNVLHLYKNNKLQETLSDKITTVIQIICQNIDVLDGINATYLWDNIKINNKKINPFLQSLILNPAIKINQYITILTPSIETEKGTFLFYLCNYNEKAILNMLLERQDLDINKGFELIDTKNNVIGAGTPLYIACQNGHLEIVKQLLEQPNIDINKPTNYNITPLIIACQNKHLDVVEQLLGQPNIDINKQDNDGITALYMACQNGHYKVVQQLFEKPNLDVNISTNVGATALYIACQNGHDKVVQQLLKKPDHIDINKQDNDGITPLYRACENGHLEIVKQLLGQPNIDINKQDKNGTTPLIISCYKKNFKNLDVVTELLAHLKTDVNKCSNKGLTALYVACQSENIDLVQRLLIQPNIDINISSIVGATALTSACYNWSVKNKKISTQIIEALIDDPTLDQSTLSKTVHILFQLSKFESINILINHLLKLENISLNIFIDIAKVFLKFNTSDDNLKNLLLKITKTVKEIIDQENDDQIKKNILEDTESSFLFAWAINPTESSLTMLQKRYFNKISPDYLINWNMVNEKGNTIFMVMLKSTECEKSNLNGYLLKYINKFDLTALEHVNNYNETTISLVEQSILNKNDKQLIAKKINTTIQQLKQAQQNLPTPSTEPQSAQENVSPRVSEPRSAKKKTGQAQENTSPKTVPKNVSPKATEPKTKHQATVQEKNVQPAVATSTVYQKKMALNNLIQTVNQSLDPVEIEYQNKFKCFNLETVFFKWFHILRCEYKCLYRPNLNDFDISLTGCHSAQCVKKLQEQASHIISWQLKDTWSNGVQKYTITYPTNSLPNLDIKTVFPSESQKDLCEKITKSKYIKTLDQLDGSKKIYASFEHQASGTTDKHIVYFVCVATPLRLAADNTWEIVTAYPIQESEIPTNQMLDN